MGFIAVYNRAVEEITNLLQREPVKPGQADLTRHIIPYGFADAQPLKLSKAIQDSVTASACAQTVAKFIRGSDFSDPALSKKIINSNQETFWEFHCKNSESLSSFRGFAIRVRYNRQGKITEINSLPFENCRLGIPDDNGFISKIKYCPFFGTNQVYIKDIKEYDVFNPDPLVVLAQIQKQGNKYRGQILYWGETSPLSRFYPYPRFMAALNWMFVESKISEFHNKNLDNGFFQSILMRFIGDPNQESTHPDDQVFDQTLNNGLGDKRSIRTTADRMNLEMQKFSGSSKVGNVMVQWGSNKDEWPDIQAFPSNGNQELFTNISAEAIDKIVLGFNVPGILANIQKGATLGGDGNQIRVAVKLMQHNSKDDQTNICIQYKKLLTAMVESYSGEVSIINYDPYPEVAQVDVNVWSKLTLNEQRSWIKKNTSYEILVDKPQTTETSRGDIIPIDPIEVSPAPTAPPAAMIKNMLFTSYPENAKKNALRAMRESKDCMNKMGWDRAQRIADGLPLSYKEIRAIYSFLNRNAWAKDKLLNESCDAVKFLGWGGQEMYKWAGETIKSIEK